MQALVFDTFWGTHIDHPTLTNGHGDFEIKQHDDDIYMKKIEFGLAY